VNHRNRPFGAVSLLLAAACLFLGTLAGAQNAPSPRNVAPPPNATTAQNAEASRIRPGDKLLISVWKEEGLTQTAIVRPDGGFSFPLAGELNARNKTIAAVTEEIRSRLVRLIPEAMVSVDVAELRGARVYIIGQVNMPGEFIMVSSLDVIQALSMAGGLTAFAAPSDIRILRRSAAGQTAIRFDYNAVIRGRDLEQNITLEDGDVVIVP
jgi:polysaccharide export outer membrane protein